jgi:hypothetical protein
MRQPLALLLLLAPLTLAAAQRPITGALVGRVLDAVSGAPLVGAELVIASSNRRTLTDSAGAYRFSDLSGGVHTMEVRLLGYRVQALSVSVISGAESDADVRLTRVVTLDTVETKAAGMTYISPALRQFEERRRAGYGKFIDEPTMRKNDDRTLGNTLKRISGIRVFVYNNSEYVGTSRSVGGQSGALQGKSPPLADPSRRDSPRGCWVAVYVDGVMLYNGDPRQPAPDLSKILVRELAGAEFYAGSASLPAQFSAIKASDCGVLLLWTRER